MNLARPFSPKQFSAGQLRPITPIWANPAIRFNSASRGQKVAFINKMPLAETLAYPVREFFEPCYELWFKGDLIGLCRLPYRSIQGYIDCLDMRDELDGLMAGISLEVFYVLKPYRSKGFEMLMARTLVKRLLRVAKSDFLSHAQFGCSHYTLLLEAECMDAACERFLDTISESLSHEMAAVVEPHSAIFTFILDA